jgi:hypothetical protein
MKRAFVVLSDESIAIWFAYQAKVGGSRDTALDKRIKDLSVDKRCTASFTILDIGALKHFKKGQEVEGSAVWKALANLAA